MQVYIIIIIIIKIIVVRLCVRPLPEVSGNDLTPTNKSRAVSLAIEQQKLE